MSPANRKHHSHSSYKFSTGYGSSGSYVHPSLSSTQSSVTAPSANSLASVTERIEFLRRAQAYYQRQENGHDKVSSAEDDAVTVRNGGKGPRLPPGPPPPRSWLRKQKDAQLEVGKQSEISWRPPLDSLPGVGKWPEKGTLMHILLKSMARRIFQHIEYDHIYLSTLPLELKRMLPSYIARYGPPGGMSSVVLRCILPEASELAQIQNEPTGYESLEHLHTFDRLDLGCSAGHFECLRTVERLFVGLDPPSIANEEVPENWDEENDSNDQASDGIPRHLEGFHLHLPGLTKLSLAHPGPLASWQDLLSLLRAKRGAHGAGVGAQLTHLNLDAWPMPSIPNVTVAENAASRGAERSKDADRESEQVACALVKALARATPQLEWLSLVGCEAWWPALVEFDNLDLPDVKPLLSAPRSRKPKADVDAFGTVSANRDETPEPEEERSFWRSVWNKEWRSMRFLILAPPPQTSIKGYRSHKWIIRLVGRWGCKRDEGIPSMENEGEIRDTLGQERYNVSGPGSAQIVAQSQARASAKQVKQTVELCRRMAKMISIHIRHHARYPLELPIVAVIETTSESASD